MREFRYALPVLAIFIVLTSLTVSVQGFTREFYGELIPAAGKPGSVVEMLLSYGGQWGNVSAFMVEIPFGSDWTVEDSEFLQDGFTLDYRGKDVFRGLYTQRGGRSLSAGPVLKVRFRLSPKASDGPEQLRVYMKQILLADGTEQGDAVIPLSFEVRPPSSDEAELLALRPSEGELYPAFSPGVTEYWVTVPFSTTSMSYELQVSPGAKYSVNRKNLGAGGSDTRFEITVTAEDGKTKRVYVVTVHRDEKTPPPTASPSPPSSVAELLALRPSEGELYPAFSPGVTEYWVTVPFSITSMSYELQASPGAKYSVNRKNLGAGGSDTRFEITVTAEDGKTKRVYSVTVHRNEKTPSLTASPLPQHPTASPSPPSSAADLLALRPSEGELYPAFSPDITAYWVTVPFSITSMSYELQASPGAKYSVNRKNLGAGGSDTRFEITVTAEDGKTKRVYTVMVHRNEKTSEPAGTPEPDKTPKPTNTPKPTKTPKPSSTAKPTRTPKPSAAPEPAGMVGGGGTLPPGKVQVVTRPIIMDTGGAVVWRLLGAIIVGALVFLLFDHIVKFLRQGSGPDGGGKKGS